MQFSGESEPGEVETIIEEHKETNLPPLLLQASQALSGGAQKLSKTQRYKQNLKAREGNVSEEVSTIVVMMLTLVTSAWSVPGDMKPNDNEIQAFSVPATRMILRHVPITAKLSKDALDLIGMIGTMSAYYIRTSDAWKEYQAARQAAKLQTQAQAQETGPFAFDRGRLSERDIEPAPAQPSQALTSIYDNEPAAVIG